jgi:hypothetical protein
MFAIAPTSQRTVISSVIELGFSSPTQHLSGHTVGKLILNLETEVDYQNA